MLKTQSSVEPQQIILSALGASVTVRLTTNVEEKTRQDDDESSTFFEYDEVVFQMPYRESLQKDIEDNFEVYFGYGIQYMEQQESLKNKKNEIQSLVDNSELPNELRVLMLAIVETYEEMIDITLENSLAIVEIYERLEG